MLTVTSWIRTSHKAGDLAVIEADILYVLNWTLKFPTASEWVETIASSMNLSFNSSANERVLQLVWVCYMHNFLVDYRPSVIAIT